MPVGLVCCLAQLFVNPVQKFLRLLGVTVHVPLIGPLGIDEFLPCAVAEILSLREIWVTVMGDVALRRLGHGNKSDNEQQTDDYCEESGF